LHPSIPDQIDALFLCAEESCPGESHYFASGSFTGRKYLKHLSDEHGLSDKTERDKLVPKFLGNPCFFPTCGSEELFPQDKKGREAYIEHLAVEHGVEDEAEQVEYSRACIRGLVLPMQPKVVPKATSRRARHFLQDDSGDSGLIGSGLYVLVMYEMLRSKRYQHVWQYNQHSGSTYCDITLLSD
jgi:hypothetical protein